MTDPQAFNPGADALEQFRLAELKVARLRAQARLLERIAARELVRFYGLDIGDSLIIKVPSRGMSSRPRRVRGTLECAYAEQGCAFLVMRLFTHTGDLRMGLTDIRLDKSAEIVSVATAKGAAVSPSSRTFAISAREAELVGEFDDASIDDEDYVWE